MTIVKKYCIVIYIIKKEAYLSIYLLYKNSIMPSIFYEIFNKNIKISEQVLKQLKEELEILFEKFKEKHDIDYVKVLRNKLTHLLEEKHKKIDKKTQKELKSLWKFLEEINEYIANQEEETKLEIIDVVKKIEKKYKKCDDLSEEKRKKYRQVCKKKATIQYEKELIKLQVELLKLQRHIKDTWEKLLIIFEWRDAAGKWGTIKRFREYLNPRWAEVVALEKPNEQEKTQWYFQRYVKELPSAWEMKFFDRSWYNRAWVEPVMWFVSKKAYEQFLSDVPKFEKMLVDSGVKLVKFYFSVWKTEQAKRFLERQTNPLKQYKLSPIDQYSQQLWEKYTLAEYKNFSATHKKQTPWTLIKSDDKKKARINAIKYVLNQCDYKDKIDPKELKVDSEIVYNWEEKVRRLSEEIDTSKDLFD